MKAKELLRAILNDPQSICIEYYGVTEFTTDYKEEIIGLFGEGCTLYRPKQTPIIGEFVYLFGDEQPEGIAIDFFIISPDGTNIVFYAIN